MASAKQKRTFGIYCLLQYTLGMDNAAAVVVARRWERTPSESQNAFMGTFVQKAIEAQIDEYRKQSFAKFGLEIAVSTTPKPLFDQSPDLPLKAKGRKITLQTRLFGKVEIGHESYYFEPQPQHVDKPQKRMRVRLCQGAVQVRFKSSWQPVSAYLDEVGTHRTQSDSPQVELDRQYCWWGTNGKHFNFMKLPGELRNAIFDCVFPSETRSGCGKHGKLVPTFQQSYTALMRTNRQLHCEAGDRFYQMTTFLIGDCGLSSQVLNNRILGERLRHVRLHLTHSGYLDLFHYKREGQYVARQLRTMPNLASLEIHFNAPSSLEQKPWLDGACQRLAIDVIMDAAWPSIRGLPVILTGYIKDSQKKGIEARVKAERVLYGLSLASGNCSSLRSYDASTSRMMAEEQGGVRLDGRPWEDDTGLDWGSMSIWDKKAAVWCECETKCTKDGWNPVD
jgi:hypothetical protein